MYLVGLEDELFAAYTKIFSAYDAIARLDRIADLQNGSIATLNGCVMIGNGVRPHEVTSFLQWLHVDQTGHAASVILLVDENDTPHAIDCMKAGAYDLLVQPFRASELGAALASGMNAQRKRRCVLDTRKFIAARVGKLTSSERVVANLIAEGLLTKQIAAALERSENTIKIHRHRIFIKLGVSSSASLARMLYLLD